MKHLIAIGLATLPAIPVQAEMYTSYPTSEHDKKGQTPLTLRVVNETDAVIACTVQLAHWYSVDLGHIGPGNVVATTLWHDPDTGELALLNDHDDRMPIEGFWCALVGNVGEPQSHVPLPFTRGSLASGTSTATCRMSEGRLICTGHL